MYFLGIILASIIAYFIGSISWSIIVVYWRRGTDIRKHGSGNAGATNTLRVLGPFWGFIVALLDGLKVVVAAGIAVLFSLIPHELFSQTSYFIPALFVLIGHCWPIYYKFKGGKAVACFIGLIAISNILYFFVFLIVWFTVAAISRKVSLSSIIAASIIGLIIWLPWLNGMNSFTWQWNSFDTWNTEVWSSEWLRFAWFNYFHLPVSKISGFQFADSMLEIIIINLLGGMLLIYRHAANINRLKKRTEPVTFPKLTKAEKAELKKLRKENKPSRAQVKEIRRLEKIEKLSQKGSEISGEIKDLRSQKSKTEQDNSKTKSSKKRAN